MLSGVSRRAVASTCASSGLPASLCSTFGKSEFIRLPTPAARMTTESGMNENSGARAGFLAFRAQSAYRAQLRHGARELRLGLGEFQLVGAAAHGLFGARLGGNRRRLVEVLGAGRRIGEHRD